MKVGSLGPVTFEVSEKKYQSLRDLSWKSAARYSTHSIVGKKAILEYTGVDPDEISFELYLSAYLGVNPDRMLQKLEKMLQLGTRHLFILGTRQIGAGSWVITDLNRVAEHHYKDGTVATYTVKIVIKEAGEYAPAVSSPAKTTNSGKTGWKKENGKWYYYENGRKVKGWKKVGRSWYYLAGSDGHRLANTSRKINGVTYRFNADGVCANPPQ